MVLFMGVDISEPTSSKVDFSGSETLMDPLIGDVEEDNDSMEVGVGDDWVGCGGFEKGVDSEVEIVPVERESEAKTTVVNVRASQVAEGEETRLSGGDKEVKGEEKDTVQVQNLSDLGIDDVELKIGTSNDFLTQKAPSDICTEQTSDVLESQFMEVDEQEKVPGVQTVNSCVFDTKVPMEKVSNDSDEINLVVDLNPCMRASGNARDDRNIKVARPKAEFSVSDLVWGKVRSHPWWPGQIFDPSAGSNKAKKYYKKDSYLVAYFGDQTFAFNEVSKLMPFTSYFSEMEKQSNVEEFHYAVDCALEEVSRRVEFGLTCPCMPTYDSVKTQIIVNAGIKDEYSRMDGRDSVSGLSSFNPVNLIEYVKRLSQFPFGEVDRLEFLTVQAQLLAFNHWKGYLSLPEFQILGELLECDEEIPLSAEMKQNSEVITDNGTELEDDELVSSGKGKSKVQDNTYNNHKHISVASVYSTKTEKNLSDLMAEKGSPVPNQKNGMDSKLARRSVSPCSGKKRKTLYTISNESVVKHSKGHLSPGDGDNSSQHKKTYRVGDSILRAANQLNGSMLMLKSVDGTSKKSVKNKSKGKSQARKTKGKNLLEEGFSPDEMVSQFCLLAADPMKECSLLKPIITSFTEFRNSVCLEHLNSQQFKENILDGIEKEPKNLEASAFELEQMKYSNCTDRTIQTIPEEKLSLEHWNEAGDFVPETSTEKAVLADDMQSTVSLVPNVDSEPQTAGGILDLATLKPVSNWKENCSEDPFPTALILKFTNLDSVPSETNLNEIFSQFGPLKESETEILKKSSRAKVVFHRRVDAEAAFSSAGKDGIFGPALVSYRLKYMSSAQSRSSSDITKQSRKDTVSS